MTTSEILNRIDIPRHKLYYLEKRGYIKSQTIVQGNHKIKDYSKDDFVKIQTIWHLVKQGLKYQAAYEKAMDVIDDR